MYRWQAGYLNELLLMLYRKKMIVFIVVSAILPVLLAVSLNALQPYLGLLAVSSSFPIALLSIYTGLWIPLYILTVTADLFPAEVAARTLKLSLLRPNSRFQVFSAKLAAIGTGIALILLVLGIMTFICNLFSGTMLSAAEGFHFVEAYVAAFIAMIAIAALFACMAQFFKSASGFIVAGIIFYAAAKIVPFIFSSFSAFSPTAYTDWHMLWLSPTVSAGKLLTSGSFLVSSCMLFFTLGYYRFDKKEV